MERFNEKEITLAYKGKPFSPGKLRKIAMGSGDARAAVYSRRITRSQGELIGITDEIFNKWWDDGIYFTVYIDIIDSDNIIEDCGIQMSKDGYREDGSPCFIKIDPRNQDLEIYYRIMHYITSTD